MFLLFSSSAASLKNPTGQKKGRTGECVAFGPFQNLDHLMRELAAVCTSRKCAVRPEGRVARALRQQEDHWCSEARVAGRNRILGNVTVPGGKLSPAPRGSKR